MNPLIFTCLDAGAAGVEKVKQAGQTVGQAAVDAKDAVAEKVFIYSSYNV